MTGKRRYPGPQAKAMRQMAADVRLEGNPCPPFEAAELAQELIRRTRDCPGLIADTLQVLLLNLTPGCISEIDSRQGVKRLLGHTLNSCALRRKDQP